SSCVRWRVTWITVAKQRLILYGVGVVLVAPYPSRPWWSIAITIAPEVGAQHEANDMVASTENAAQLTAEQVSTILTKPLEQRSIFMAAGPTIFDTNGSPVRIPAMPASQQDELQWVGENELIPEVDPEFGETELLPSTMKSVKTITRYSNELARQSIVSLD